MYRAVAVAYIAVMLVALTGCGGSEEPPPEENPTSSVVPTALQKKPPAPKPTPPPAPAPAQTAAATPAAKPAPATAAGATPAPAASEEAPAGGGGTDEFNAQLVGNDNSKYENDESSGFEGMGGGGAGGGLSEFDRQLMGLDSRGDPNDESTGFEGMGGGLGAVPAALRGGPGGAGGAALGGGPGGAPVEPGFKRSGLMAFMSGQNRDAMEYMMAHALTSEDGADDLFPSMMWVPALQRPALGVRWGVGLHLIAPKKFDEDPKPIGSTQEFEADEDEGGRGSGGGDFSGDFGSGGEDFGSGGDFGSAPGGFGGGGGGQNSGNDTVNKYAGEFGEYLIEELQARIDEGYFGEVFANAPKGGRRRAAETGRRARRGRKPAPTADFISPGLTFVGLSKAKNGDKELLSKARDEGVDALLIFRVTVKKHHKKEFITNEAVATVYDATKGERWVWTRALQNIKVQHARENEEDDGIDAEIEKITNFVDSKLATVDLPAAINNSNVARRVEHISSSQVDEKMLATLTEIRFWNHAGFLDDDKMAQAFQGLLGQGPGGQLASGEEDEKKEAINNWLPGQAGGSLSRGRSLPPR